MSPGNRRKALLFIESNTSGTAYLFALAARELRWRPVLVTAHPEKYAYVSKPGGPEVVTVASTDDDEIDDVIRRGFSGGADVCGITSSSEYFVATAAALAARYRLPGPDAACIRAARDKSWQRTVLAAAGLPTPEFRIAASVAGAVAAAREIRLPVVVKPVDGTGSAGVRACASARQVEQHAALLLAQDNGRHGRILIEALVTGPEFSVEVFSGRVIGITRKHVSRPPCFVETGHDYPARILPGVSQALIDTVTCGTALLGLGWGPLHWELRVREGRAYVMEVNPRLAGGFIPELVRHAEGIDLIRETLRLVTGGHPHLEPHGHRHASIRFLFPPTAGRLAGVDHIADVGRLNGVVDVALYRSPGDDLTVHNDFRDRIGHVIACAETHGAASASAEHARNALAIRVEAAGAA